VDVRIISASHKDLEAMVSDGAFRQDLYYRINVIGITVPTLSERAIDIPQLADYLIEKHNYQNAGNVSISEAAVTALGDYSFPGNVRELENILERALALCENERIETADLQLPEASVDDNENNLSLGEITQSLEKEHIINALEDNRWNQSATARSLGLTLRQLRYRIEKLRLKNS
jgi:two-component system response regulator PilR (NtrC family)